MRGVKFLYNGLVEILVSDLGQHELLHVVFERFGGVYNWRVGIHGPSRGMRVLHTQGSCVFCLEDKTADCFVVFLECCGILMCHKL